MKKLFILFLLCGVTMVGYAQRTQTTTTTYTTTKTDYLNAQARIPQALVQPLVKPLVAEVQVVPPAEYANSEYLVRGDKTGHKFVVRLTGQEVEVDMGGNLEDVQNYGVYKVTDEIGCDMLLAPVYLLKGNSQDGYVLEIKGIPAKFAKIASATPADYEWMKIPHAIELSTNPAIFTSIKKSEK